MYKQNHAVTFDQNCSIFICIPKRCILWKKKDFCQFLPQRSYISGSSAWSVWIAGTKHVAHWKILGREILSFSRKLFWVIVRIHEKSCRRIWLPKECSSIIFLVPFSQQEKQPVRREWNDSFSPLSSLLPIIMVPEYAEGGLVGQTRITKYPSSLHIGERLKSFLKTSSLWPSKKAATKVIWFWWAVFSQNYAIKTKSDHRQITQKFNILFRLFNAEQLLNVILCQSYEQSILLAKRITLSRSCKFSIFVSRYSFTIVPFHGTSSVSVECLLRRNGTRNRLKFFYDRNWFWWLPTENAAGEQFSFTNCHMLIR